MRLATTEEYQMYWRMVKLWYLLTYSKEDYHAIGAVAEYLANQDKISLYNQSLRDV